MKRTATLRTTATLEASLAHMVDRNKANKKFHNQVDVAVRSGLPGAVLAARIQEAMDELHTALQVADRMYGLALAQVQQAAYPDEDPAS